MPTDQAARSDDDDRDSPREPLAILRDQIDRLDEALLDLVEQRLRGRADDRRAEDPRADDGHLKLRPRREQEIVARLAGRAALAPRGAGRGPVARADGLQPAGAGPDRAGPPRHRPAAPDRLRAPAVRLGRPSCGPQRPSPKRSRPRRRKRRSPSSRSTTEADWIDGLDKRLPIFDWLRDEQGEVVAVAVGRIPVEEMPDHPALGTLPKGAGR